MNAERVLAHYERIADAPDAIARLRRFILDLAVRGRLVPQDPSEESASELLKRVVADKGRSAKASSVEKARLVPSNPNGARSFSTPIGWAWTTLGTVANIVMGQSPPGDTYNTKGEGVPLINGPVEFSAGPFGRTVVNQYTTAPTNFCEEGNLLICVRGSTTGRTNVAAFRACIGRGVAAIQPYFNHAFVWLFIWNSRGAIIDMGRGIAFPSVSRKQLEDIALPLPPLAEQNRIVAKVDELMALCERIEAARTEREATRNKLTAASLTRLNTPDPETFQADARFALDALPTLTTRPDQIKQLRQTIFNLAVSGKLVPQDPSVEPASELLKRIAKEKARLVKAREIKDDKPLPPITDQEKPVLLPPGWEWTRLGYLIHLVSGQHLQPPEYSEDAKVGLPYITGPSDFGTDGLHITRFALVKKAVAKKGQLLLTVKGSGVGKTATCDIPEVAISRQLMALTAIAWDDRYLILVTHRLAEKLQEQARSLIPGISREDVEEFVFALPPLAEQYRIVAKVDELIALCDRLEKNLANGEDIRRRLLDALLAEALEPVEGDLEQAA
jgi:type I restriction enzyme S subunit